MAIFRVNFPTDEADSADSRGFQNNDPRESAESAKSAGKLILTLSPVVFRQGQ
jgi:hypothetical protein